MRENDLGWASGMDLLYLPRRHDDLPPESAAAMVQAARLDGSQRGRSVKTNEGGIMINIGQEVLVYAKVALGYGERGPDWTLVEDETARWADQRRKQRRVGLNTVRRMWRQELDEPVRCIFLGQTTRQTGVRDFQDEVGNIFQPMEYHIVWAVQEISGGSYRRPMTVLMEDIQEVSIGRSTLTEICEECDCDV